MTVYRKKFWTILFACAFFALTFFAPSAYKPALAEEKTYVSVSTEEELKEAVENIYVKLEADIELTSVLKIENSLVLDMGSYTLSGAGLEFQAMVLLEKGETGSRISAPVKSLKNYIHVAPITVDKLTLRGESGYLVNGGRVKELTLESGSLYCDGCTLESLTVNGGSVTVENGTFGFDPSPYVNDSAKGVMKNGDVYQVGKWVSTETEHWVVDENNAQPHTYGEWKTKTPASCTSPEIEEATCICGHSITREGDPRLEHTYSETYSSDGSGHWHVCECGAKSEVHSHLYEWSADRGVCMYCGYVKMREAAGEAVPAPKDKGISEGGLIAISAVCALAAAGGAFAVIWFKVKKKTWKDIVLLFRRKDKK